MPPPLYQFAFYKFMVVNIRGYVQFEGEKSDPLILDQQF